MGGSFSQKAWGLGNGRRLKAFRRQKLQKLQLDLQPTKMFSLVKVGERAGSGVPNMVDRWVSCGYARPELSEEVDPEVSTTWLPLSKLTADGSEVKSAVNIGSKARATTADRSNSIFAYLSNHGESRSADIAESIGFGTSRTNDLLRGLVEGGFVETVGGYRNRRYKLSGR